MPLKINARGPQGQPSAPTTPAVSTLSLSSPRPFRNAPAKLTHTRFPSSPLPVRMPGLAPKVY
jgi:hypothetical protein